MCGITGVCNLQDRPPVERHTLRQMLEMLRHRGPDGLGIYRDPYVGLGSARLSIIDLTGGDQPIGNEDGSLWVVLNGEIFNYVELRPALEARGHRFSTQSDTEVILHLYEEHGPECLSHMNGQFALAVWDQPNQTLFLGRDRVGIRPLFYTVHDGRLIFASEIKSILAYPGLQVRIDRQALEETFTFWSPLSPHSIFEGIYQLPPGNYLIVKEGQITIRPYWSLDFEEDRKPRSADEYLEEFESLLIDSSRIRLRADVPVGAYLSGGLDSSVVAAVIRRYSGAKLDTFSISFSDPRFDESAYQRRMADFLGTQHQVAYIDSANIAQVFPDIIWHAETPLLRTAPAPMFLLSELVHQNGYKVVLTGEGADEILGGYDIFKEQAIRRFWRRDLDSQMRPALFRRLYPEIFEGGSRSGAFLAAFFRKGLEAPPGPYDSHRIRWQNSARNLRFLNHFGLQTPLSDEKLAGAVPLPLDAGGWTDLGRAQYLEMVTFLSPYLLSSQGDRMAMAHAVEGRYPYLDYRVIELCNRMPSFLKLPGLKEKWLLRQFGRKLLPEDVWQRRKRPYRAPIHSSFFHASTPDYVSELFSEQALRDSRYFKPSAHDLFCKAAENRPISEVEDMALAGILSTQLIHQQFVKSFHPSPVKDESLKKLVEFSLVS